MTANQQDIEQLQRLTARVVATHPAGHGLSLIGGFRFRLLDQSARFSRDIDYHFEGDLAEKQQALVKLFRRVLLPLIRRQLGYDGSAGAATGADADSPNACFVDLAFWKPHSAGSRIELPLEITRVALLDPIIVRTAEGVVYPTLSDADLVEGKIVAILNRVFLEHRDLVDLFLYGDRLLPNSARRIERKLKSLRLSPDSIERRLRDLKQHASHHTRSVQKVIDEQLEPEPAANINVGGGAQIVFRRALELVLANVVVSNENS